ncbi:hypothetical protein EW146_g5557 [Bondarzewia mesenterica]|uniref:Uncharacterized protein n=1 Tax=Bondarzewia mesenterica TaxID=1095465 RepID=A0A4S4LR44_9AGAM|nr:hypothetical protein EW146_g5557 [Bondarzewia mesenterica]
MIRRALSRVRLDQRDSTALDVTEIPPTAPPRYSAGNWDLDGEEGRATNEEVTSTLALEGVPTMDGSHTEPEFAVHATELPVVPPGAIVLSWEVEEPDSPVGSTQTIPMPAHEPFGAPPGYNASRTPTEPTTYTFSPYSFNSMLLLPPATAADTRPQYYIAVHMNCFVPTSFITIIRRGASDNGQYVGEFEMGVSERRDTVSIGQQKKWIDRVLTRQGSVNCYKGERPSTSQDTLLAKFTPPDYIEPGQPRTASDRLGRLQVMPAGQQLFDMILLTMLILERKRLTPS